ncbi:BadF/BadG/BcrA/BcrD ATPase family protein [Kutzneria sp. NPDC051319]|uniref:N-acetylglucosamine kinase n=1 Tax=Kutzneria sp. NPDC051319 TaxID=3155047 RepID=UPI003444825D
MANTEGYLVGVDAGGTTTRALVADLTGARVGTGRAGGANPNSHPPEVAAEQVAAAIAAALASAGVPPDRVRAGVLGLAGASKLADDRVAALFDAAWHGAGLKCGLRVVTDAEAAFAAGTAASDGTVLVAGTGSAAARIVNRRQVAIAGGFGWLLGDEGSAFWLGRQAVRATLRTLATGAALGALARSVLSTVVAMPEVSGDPMLRRSVVSRLITAVNAEPPIHLARLAPLVTSAAEAHDPLAAEIVEEAVDWLVRTARDARSGGERTPVVVIGSVAAGGGVLGQRLLSALEEACGGEVTVASDGAAGAAWLASLELLGPAALTLRPQLLSGT